MIRLFIIIVMLVCFSNTQASDSITKENKYIRTEIEWKKGEKADTVIFKIRPLVNLFVMDNDGCFSLDTSYKEGYTLAHFWNINCPLFIINQCFGSTYRLLPKDTVIFYRWVSQSKRKPNRFVCDIHYIPTNTQEFRDRKSHLVEVPIDNGIGLSISIEDEAAMQQQMQLWIDR